MWKVLLVALFLRLVLLNQSLWLDEAIQALALQGRLGPILEYALADFQPPLYHFLGLIWTKIAGFREVSLRTLSLLAGLGTVYFAVKLGELIANPKVSRIVGYLAATNPLLIYYSQEGRTYSLTTFLVTASFYYLLAYFKQPKRIYLFSYLFFTVLFLWSSYLAWFVALAQGLYLLGKRNWPLFIALLVATSSLILWLPSLFKSLSFGLGDASSLSGWAQVVGGTSLKALALTWIKLNLGRISFPNPLLYALVVLALALLHFMILKKARTLSPNSRPLIIWLLVPLLFASLVSLVIPVYSYTRVLFVVPAYLLLLAFGLSRLPRSVTYLAVLSQLIFLLIFWLTPRFHRENWRSLSRDLNAQTDLLVAIPSLKVTAPLTYYQLTHTPLALPDLASTNQPLYYIRYAEEIFDPSRLGLANLTHFGYTLKEERTYTGLVLEIYEKP